MRQRIAAIRSKTETLARPRVLYVINSQPLITVGPGSFIHQVIDLAGGANVAGQATAPYPRLNMEAVIKEDPEIILFPVGAAEGIPPDERQAWQRWASISAVKHGRLHQIPADLLNRPGPRIVEGLERLARTLHPEVFPGALVP
jgi:iron complex transport system substrate-binding protein